MIHLFQPYVTKEAKDNVARVLDSGWLGLGPEVEAFEKEFAKYIGCKHAVALNSCTAALHLALHARPRKNRAIVMTTPNTFVATNHIILQEGLVPCFIDIDPYTGAMDPGVLEARLRQEHSSVEAVIVVHYAGSPVNLDKFRYMAHKYKFYLIEDAAHATGASYKGTKIGADSIAACFSFHAVKNLATGDGGMLVTSDAEIAEKARKLRWFGIDKSTLDRMKGGYSWEYDIESVGWKYHMNDITAALGRGQLATLEVYNEKRRHLYDVYRHFLEPKKVHLLYDEYGSTSSRHLAVVKFVSSKSKRKAMDALKKEDIQFGYHYKPNYLYRPYAKYGYSTDTPGMEDFYKSALTLPMHPFLKECDVERICGVINEA